MRRIWGMLATGVLCTVLAAPAHAAWPGTPGRIAWMTGTAGDLHVVDPTPGGTGTAQTIETNTVPQGSNKGTFAGAGISAPAWSPDGTTLAYAKAIVDYTVGPATVLHTAIWTWNVETGVKTQVTTPPTGYPDCNGQSPCNVSDGYEYADIAPAWSSDGTLRFVRLLGAGKDAVNYAQRGGDVYTAGSGGVQKIIDMPTAQYVLSMSAGGDPDTGNTALVGIVATEGQQDAKLEWLDNGQSVLLDSIKNAELGDYDVSPDGQHVDYLCGCGGTPTAKRIGINGGQDASLGGVLTIGLHSSPTGNGPIFNGFVYQSGQAPQQVVQERQAKDATRDQWPEDPQDRTLYPADGFATPTTGGDRLAWDIQPQHLPIVGIPGFAGSKLYCNGNAEWPISPSPSTNATYMQDLALDASGASPQCSGSGPYGDPLSDTGIVADVFGGAKDVYQPMIDFVDQLGESGQGHMFSWDWRKSPEDNVARLKGAVDQLLDKPFARAQGAHQVVLFAHSYGGLLVRQYVEDHPDDVARVLTAGTPYWGAPKAFFAIAFGIENPLSGILDLDTFIPNDALKAFMNHNAGVYHLLPSSHFGPWLTVDNAAADQTQTANWLTGVGGADSAAISAAYGWHQAHDGFFTNGGKIDMRAVIGTGTLTIVGADVPGKAQPDGTVPTIIRLDDGDGTVPAISATQGPVGTHQPLGDPVHVQAVCRVEHVPLPGSPKVTSKYRDFLLHGRTPLKTSGACRPSGSAVEVKNLDVTPRSGTRSVRAASGGALSLFDAWYDGHIQLVDMPGDPTAVTSDDDPVDLSVGNPNGAVTLRIQHFSDGQAGPVDVYGPLTGDVVVHSGATGVSVTVGGQPVAPNTTTSSTTTTPAGGGATTTPPTTPAPGTSSPAQVRLSLLVTTGRLARLLAHGLRVRTTCPARCTIALKLAVPAAVARRLHLRSRTVAAGHASTTKAGTATVLLRFTAVAKRALRHARSVGVTLGGSATVAGGAAIAPKTLTLRR